MRLRTSPHPPDLFDGERHRAGMLAANQLAPSQNISIEETLLAAAPFTNVSIGARAGVLSEDAPRQHAEKEIAGLGSS